MSFPHYFPSTFSFWCATTLLRHTNLQQCVPLSYHLLIWHMVWSGGGGGNKSRMDKMLCCVFSWLESVKETVLFSNDWDWLSFQRRAYYFKILLPPNLLKTSVSITNSRNFHYWNCDLIRAHSKYCSEHVWKNFPVGMHPLGTHKAEKVIPLKVSSERDTKELTRARGTLTL